MKSLKKILFDLKITSDIELANYISENYNNQDGLPLKIIKNIDLELDSENRIFDEEIVYKNTIFDIDNINILNSNSILLQDCIFTGSLRVANKDENTPTNILLNTIIVKEKLFVSGADNISKCIISDINCTELNIINNDIISNLSVTGCNIGIMTIYNTKCKNFSAFFNTIDRFEFSYSDFQKVDFSKNHININNHKLLFKEKDLKSVRKKHKNFIFNKIDHEKLSVNEKLLIASETSKFLILNTDYFSNRNDHARLKYISGLASIPNQFHRIIYQVFGGLIIPYRILLIMLATITLFSLFYYCSNGQFLFYNEETSLNFSKAFYFSGISFTTIGYGDIAPLNFVRYIAIAEGVIGILLSGVFVISLTRKYID